MTEKLHDWLKETWERDNHKKYHHLFNDWVVNITDEQILGFEKMEGKRNIYK